MWIKTKRVVESTTVKENTLEKRIHKIRQKGLKVPDDIDVTTFKNMEGKNLKWNFFSRIWTISTLKG